MSEPNWTNRTLWTSDNLDILRGMNSETVDLIYLDPPFNSNREYAAPIGSKAAGAAFKDTWTLSDLDVAWAGYIADEHPALENVLSCAGMAHSKGMQSYLTMMAVRMLELHRVLKPTGSLYLHCDPTASHYLKQLLDTIFGQGRFRNEIIWERTKPKGNMTRRYPTNHDVIFAYGKTDKTFWDDDEVFIPYDLDNLDEKTLEQYDKIDSDGRRYQLTSLLNPNKDRPNLTYELLGVERVWRWERDRMQAEYERGRVVQTAPGNVPRYKRYLDEQRGKPLTDIWTGLEMTGQEDTDYPTQKPVALLDRIIRAATAPGDMILDPFCGCATTCVAAERLERQWVGIDLSSKAVDLINDRLRDDMGDLFHYGFVTSRTDIPRRTDIEAPKDYRTHKHILYGTQEGCCNGCKVHFEFRNLTVDHIVPRKRGGTDHESNLQLLCAHCNSVKGDRPMEYLLAHLADPEKRA